MERSRMRRAKLNFDKFHWADFPKLVAVALLLTVWFPTRSMAKQSGQKTFSSPEDASHALLTAAQSNDEKAMLDILGPDGKQIVASGDETEDANGRANFVEKYQEMHRLVKEPDGTTPLYLGAENWPTPIPLVNQGKSWYFDTEAGRKEILYRRIGENEFGAISVCHALVEAQNDYYSQPRDGRVQQYTQVLASDDGQHKGLFWKTADGEPESPIGPLVAYAASVGYDKPYGQEHSPFHGYYYRILSGQGKSAQGGANSYIVNGQMAGGFGILAYPANRSEEHT